MRITPFLRIVRIFRVAVVCGLLGTVAGPSLAAPLAANVRADRILVEKGRHRLTLFSHGVALQSYRVALGRSAGGKKERQGDDRTPEGLYTIDRRSLHSRFHRALHISYPNAADRKAAARLGVPAGGDIMIHGLPNGRGWIGAAHAAVDWTAGCIAVTDREIEEIWRAVADGTPVEIRP